MQHIQPQGPAPAEQSNAERSREALREATQLLGPAQDEDSRVIPEFRVLGPLGGLKISELKV